VCRAIRVWRYSYCKCDCALCPCACHCQFAVQSNHTPYWEAVGSEQCLGRGRLCPLLDLPGPVVGGAAVRRTRAPKSMNCPFLCPRLAPFVAGHAQVLARCERVPCAQFVEDGKGAKATAAQRNSPIQSAAPSPKVGHSGHNGNAPGFGEVCPRNPLQHNGFSELGTVGTLGTVALQVGDYKNAYREPGSWENLVSKDHERQRTGAKPGFALPVVHTLQKDPQLSG
jgi:hypothetical protein